MVPDNELLGQYVAKGSQPAFTELVQRHGNSAYRAALRRLGGDAHAAQDVVQRVFIDLARKAHRLDGRQNLAGWIHAGVRFAANDLIRGERRRRLREHKAMEDPAESPAIFWEKLEPWIDEMIEALPDHEREAIILHFFEGRSFAEVGGLLALGADAARMRVNRALERLRREAARRGTASSAAVLGECLLTQSATAAGLPSAQAVADHALQQAALLGPAGASLLTKGWLLFRSVSALVWVASALFIGGVAGWWVVEKKPGGQAPPLNARDEVHLVEETSVEEMMPTPAEAVPSAEEERRPTTRVPGGAGNVPVGDIGFTELGEAQKRILKILWSRELEFGTLPERRWAVSMPPDKPGYRGFIAARRALRLHGWVLVNRQGATMLTEEGLAYCIEQREAIDAFPMPNTRRGPAPDLPPPEN